MTAAPKWFLPVVIIALLWNLMGCAAYLSDAMMSTADIAKMSDAEKAMVAARPAWAIAGTAVAVWLGALGCLALIARKSWAVLLLLLSLLGVIVQDIWFFVLAPKSDLIDGTVYGLQGFVVVIAIALIWLARKAKASGWLS
jgi:surface polysaccharide O-acyltransferase-like enzyme